MDEPVRVAVMGMTGAGKSTFIKILIPDAQVVIGGDMNSQTSVPESFLVPINDRLFELVDTPGFGDTRRSDEEVLQCISEYLAARHASGELFHGVIYLHSLAHTRISGSMMAQIRAFKAVCGDRFFSRLVIGTTFWEATTNLSRALAHEAQLYSDDGIFEDVVDLGAQTTRVFNTREVCLEAIRLIPCDEPSALQVQSELSNGTNFGNTSAAAAISPEQYRRQQEHDERLRREQEDAERERRDRELRAAEEEARRARAIAEAEHVRSLELARRKMEYEAQEQMRRAAEARQALLRLEEERKAEVKRKEIQLAAEMRAKAERLAEEQRQEEMKRKRQAEEKHNQELRELRARQEERQKELRLLERSRTGYRNWHISWYHDRRICLGIIGEDCDNMIRDGMKCWDCDAIICFQCFHRNERLWHKSSCIYW